MRFSDSQVLGTFNICFGQAVGTAFLHYKGEKSFFVTAAHILIGLHVGDNVLVRKGNEWVALVVSNFLIHPEGYDIAVFSTSNFQVLGEPRKYGQAGLGLGDPVKFLGFPHGLENNYPGAGYPTPLARNAFFSGVVRLEGKDIVIFDGFNNPGYSGAPIFAPDKEDGSPALVGVVSGYRFEARTHGHIYKKDDAGNEVIVPDVYSKPNSGMIYSVGLFALNHLVDKLDTFNPQ